MHYVIIKLQLLLMTIVYSWGDSAANDFHINMCNMCGLAVIDLETVDWKEDTRCISKKGKGRPQFIF